jgi:hypothetical protein
VFKSAFCDSKQINENNILAFNGRNEKRMRNSGRQKQTRKIRERLKYKTGKERKGDIKGKQEI